MFPQQAEKQGNHQPAGKTPMKKKKEEKKKRKSVIIHSHVKDCEEERKCDKLIHSNKDRL